MWAIMKKNIDRKRRLFECPTLKNLTRTTRSLRGPSDPTTRAGLFSPSDSDRTCPGRWCAYGSERIGDLRGIQSAAPRAERPARGAREYASRDFLAAAAVTGRARENGARDSDDGCGCAHLRRGSDAGFKRSFACPVVCDTRCCSRAASLRPRGAARGSLRCRHNIHGHRAASVVHRAGATGLAEKRRRRHLVPERASRSTIPDGTGGGSNCRRGRADRRRTAIPDPALHGRRRSACNRSRCCPAAREKAGKVLRAAALTLSSASGAPASRGESSICSRRASGRTSVTRD